jgi:hypothetical protein
VVVGKLEPPLPGHCAPDPAATLNVNVCCRVDSSVMVAVTVITSVVSVFDRVVHRICSLYVLAPVTQPAREAWLVSQE